MEFLASVANLAPITFAQGLLYAFVALGIMIPFRLLNFPDLTCEGAFPFGAALCAALIVAGVAPVWAMAFALAGGFAAGCATALIHLRFGINSLLAGILMITALWSADLRIMGKSNTPIFGKPNLFDSMISGFSGSVWIQIVVWTIVSLACIALLWWFLRTEIGLAMRAVGANETMSKAQGVDAWTYTVIGVGAANALSAFAGASVAQIQGYADVAMGFGILINGLAALIIGEAILGQGGVLRQVAAPFVGSVVYYQVISLGLAAGVHPSDLKMVTALFVLITLALPGFGRRGPPTAPRARID